MKKLCVFMMICVVGVVSQAAVRGPYTVDAATLHLWHLDDAGTAVDAVAGGKDMAGLKNGATLGNASYAGFGTALMPTRWGYLTEGPADAAVTTPFAYAGADGAFTFEAIIKLNELPSQTPQQNIISMSGNAGDVFRFRLESWGLQYANTGKGEWGGAGYPGGVNAPNTTDWFHVAIAYNGQDGQADNLKYYLTNMNSAATEAYLIGTATHTDLTGALAEFYIGNMGWGHSEGLVGTLDEVRISSVARGADEMMFVPEPATLFLLALGGLTLAKRRQA